MKKDYSLQDYQRAKKAYGYLSSLIIVMAIVAGVGMLTLILAKADYQEGIFKHIGVEGLLYATSLFTLFMTSPCGDSYTVRMVTSITSIVFIILFSVCSSYAVKGKKWSLLVNMILYALDTLMLIPLFICFAIYDYPLHLTWYDFTLEIIIHLFMNILNVYLYITLERLQKYELYNN